MLGFIFELLPAILREVSLMERSGNKAVREAAQTVDETQPGLDEANRAKEIIALMAERGVHNRLVNRVLAAIRRFLRSIGIDLEFSDADLAGLIRDAERYLESGETAPTTDAGLQPLFSRTSETKDKYNSRIDELFNGGEPNRIGIRVLDSSDVLEMLGFGDKPVHLAESKIDDGRYNHKLTAEHWKKIPEWLESPVAVFDSETVPGRLVFIAPEKIGNDPVVIVVEPNTELGGTEVNLLVNAYDKTGGRMPVRRWVENGLQRYIDIKRSPAFGVPSGLQLPRVEHQQRGSKNRIYAETDLVKFRKTREESKVGALFSRQPKPHQIQGTNKDGKILAVAVPENDGAWTVYRGEPAKTLFESTNYARRRFPSQAAAEQAMAEMGLQLNYRRPRSVANRRRPCSRGSMFRMRASGTT